MTHPTDDNQFCPHCKGSGEGRAMTNHLGPDDHEYDCQCPTCGGDGSLLAAFHVANETRKRLERECEMRYQERRALVHQRDHYLSVLTDIFALTVSNPDGIEVNGVRYLFNDPNAAETLRGLSKALRAIAEKAPEVRALLAEQAKDAAEDAELLEGVEVTGYTIDGVNLYDYIKIERARQMDGPPLWAVRNAAQNCLNKSGEWEWEPMPSSRDDEFLARCRFSMPVEAIRTIRAARAAERKA